jgi:hypothetical protein
MQVADHGWRLLPQYQLDVASGAWEHCSLAGVPLQHCYPTCSLQQVASPPGVAEVPTAPADGNTMSSRSASSKSSWHLQTSEAQQQVQEMSPADDVQQAHLDQQGHAKGSVCKHRPGGAPLAGKTSHRWLPWRRPAAQQPARLPAPGLQRRVARSTPLRALQQPNAACSVERIVQLPVLGGTGFEAEGARRALLLFRRLHAAMQPQLQEMSLVTAGAGQKRGCSHQAVLLEAQRLYEKAVEWQRSAVGAHGDQQVRRLAEQAIGGLAALLIMPCDVMRCLAYRQWVCVPCYFIHGELCAGTHSAS